MAWQAEDEMRILVGNDDGIDAVGIAALADAARRLSDDVWVVAPDGNRSAAGHGISLRRPVTLSRAGERRFACSGTPADCVIAAMAFLFEGDRRPDLVLSGINEGPNVAEDVAYSGTMAVAREAVFWGIPAISLSRPKGLGAHSPAQGDWLAGLIDSFWRRREAWSADGHWLNLNLPAQVPAPLREARIGRDKIARSVRVLERGADGARLEILSAREGSSAHGDENHHLAEGFVAVTNVAWHGAVPLPPGFLPAEG